MCDMFVCVVYARGFKCIDVFLAILWLLPEHGVWCKCRANRVLKNFIGFSMFRIVEWLIRRLISTISNKTQIYYAIIYVWWLVLQYVVVKATSWSMFSSVCVVRVVLRIIHLCSRDIAVKFNWNTQLIITPSATF